MKSVREVMERVRTTRADEESARASAAKAKAEREAAERELGPAREQAKAAADVLSQGVTARLKSLETQLDRVKAREAADTMVPEPSMRLRARAFLHGGGEVPNNNGANPASGPSGLMSLVSLDAIAGGFYECSRVAGQLMQYVFDEGGDERLAERADDLECLAWRGCINRIKRLAGEEL